MALSNFKTHGGRATTKGYTTDTVVLQLVRAHARNLVSGITDLTDSSGGTASGTRTIVSASTALVNVANSGTSLASAATASASFVTVQDALFELYTKANAYATKVGVSSITYNGGGVAVDGTIASIPATTAATTGAQAATVNTNLAAFNSAFYNLAVLTNNVLHAVNGLELILPSGFTVASTVPVLATTSGSAADPGVTKVALDAEIAKLAANVATIAAALNTCNDALTTALVTAVK